MLIHAIVFLLRLAILCLSLYMAVRIRLYAVINYGRVIHEFDPWFNYRATEYMAANGWDRFQVRPTRSPLAHTTSVQRLLSARDDSNSLVRRSSHQQH